MPSFNKALRFLGYLGLALLLIVLVVSLFTPIIAKQQIKRWAEAQGAEQVELRGLFVNIWTGEVEIEKFSARTPEQPTLAFSELEVDLNYPALFQKRLQIDRIYLGQGQIPLVQDDKHWRLGPINIPMPAAEAEADEETDDSASQWYWGLQQVDIHQLAVSLDAQGQHHELTVASSSLKLLRNWLPDERSFLVANGTLNGSPFSIDSEGKPLTEHASGDFTINVEQLNLGPLLQLWLPDFAGILNADMTLSLEQTATGVQIQQQGSVSLSDHRFRQDALSLEAKQLSWQGDIETRLNAEGLESLSTEGESRLDGLKLTRDELNIGSDEIILKGSHQLSVSGTSQELNNTATLTVSALSLRQGPLDVNSNALNWEGQVQTLLDTDGLKLVASDGQLSLDALQLADEAQQLQLDTGAVNLQGTNRVSMSDGQPLINNDSQLRIDSLQLQHQAQQLDLSTGLINLNGSHELRLLEDGKTVITDDSQLNITQLDLQHPSAEVKEQQLDWQGQVKLAENQQLSIDGQLSATQTQMSAAELLLAVRDSHWQGNGQLDLGDSALQSLEGELNTRDLDVQTPEQQPLINLASLSLEGLQLAGTEQLDISNINLEQLILKQNTEPLLDLDSLQLQQLQLGLADNTPEAITIDAIALGASTTHLMLNAQQQAEHWLTWIAHLQGQDPATALQASASDASATQAQNAAENSEDNTTGPRIRIGDIALREPAKVIFNDRSANNQTINLAINELSVRDIDSGKDSPSPFTFKAKVNRFGEVNAQGGYSLLSKAANGNWEASIRGLELTPFSPYMVRMNGYQISSGQLTLDSTGSIAERQVDSNNTFRAHNLTLKRAPKPVREEAAAKASDATAAQPNQPQSGMPLDMALSLLSDDDDNIKLKIPVSGSIDDPKFGYQSVINVVLAKAAQEAAIGYLSSYLQPYGTVLSLGGFLLENMKKSALALEPVKFPAGDDELNADAEQYLGKITELLQKKSSLRLNLCGYTVAADRDALAEQVEADGVAKQDQDKSKPAVTATPGQPSAITDYELNMLAEERSASVKQFLIDQGIEQERLFLCLPEIRSNDDQPPGVMLGI